MKTKILITMLVLLTATVALAQQNRSYELAQDTRLIKNIQHSVFLELEVPSLGARLPLYWADIYNVIYDASFQLAERHKVALGLGFHYSPPYNITRVRGSVTSTILKDFHTMSITPQINYLFGRTRHLELGIGVKTFFKWGERREEVTSISFVRVGYRHQRSDGGLFVRAGFIAYMKEPRFLSLPFIPGASVGVGYTFRNRR